MGEKLHTFNKSKKVGAWAEAECRRYFSEEGVSGHGVDVIDVSEDAFYKSAGVDFIVEPIGAGVEAAILVEVKGQTYPPEYVFIESVANIGKGSGGWLYQTASAALIYYFVYDGVMVVIPTEGLREWCKRRLADFPKRGARTGARGKEWYRSEGHIAPISVLREEVRGVQVVVGLAKMGRD